MKLHWQNKAITELELSDGNFHSVIFEEGSLTYLLQAYCQGEFHIELISESWDHAILDEADLLSISREDNAFIRKSLLRCDDNTLVFARTVIPEKSLVGKNKQLTTLGEKPLGDILFNDKTSSRKHMRYAKIPVNCELHKEASAGLDITTALWGRQSLFYIEERPLTITEIFLPAIQACSKN